MSPWRTRESAAARLEAWFTETRNRAAENASRNAVLKARSLCFTRLGWLAYLAVLAITTGLSAWVAWPDAWRSGIVLAAIATLIAVGSHALAHIGVAAANDVQLTGDLAWRRARRPRRHRAPASGRPVPRREAHLSPRGPADIPAPDSASAKEPDPAATPSSRVLWRISLAGPIVNIVGAAISLGGYLLVPIRSCDSCS